MGASQSGLQAAVAHASYVLGHSAVAGRYHTPPSKLQDDYEVTDQVLGTGCGGAVHLAARKRTREKFAVKEYALYMMTNKSLQDLQMEAQIYLGLDHPHVARLVDVYQSSTHLHLVMEACTGGELFHRVEKRKKFTEMDAAKAFHQMLLAVNYLHVHDIVHSDLKLENFLYEAEDSDHLKLIDFGFSDICNHKTTLAKTRGTLAYMAPEVLLGSYTTKCDIWSLGVILFILLVGYMPFGGPPAQMRRHIKKGNLTWNEAKWSKVSAAAQALVRSLLTVDPDLRPSAEELLSNRWVTMARRSASECVDPSVAVALQQMSNQSRFRRTCLSMMAWSLSQQERALVRNYFMVMDKNRDGSISLEEFRQALRESRSSLDDVAIQEAFQAIDTGENHEINYTEFLAAMLDARLECHDNLVWSAFNRFDADNSGQITVANLKRVLGAGFSGREIERILSHADADCNGEISYDEFHAYLKNSTRGGNRSVYDVHKQWINRRFMTEANATTRPVSLRFQRDDESDVDESSEEEEEDGFWSRLLGGRCQ